MLAMLVVFVCLFMNFLHFLPHLLVHHHPGVHHTVHTVPGAIGFTGCMPGTVGGHGGG